MNGKYTVLVIAILLISPALRAQESNEVGTPTKSSFAVKTNLLYDATTTINLGVEFRTGLKTSLDIPINYNPWTFDNNKKWKHLLVQPEFRYWTAETFRGHFFGLHGHYAYYNIGGLDNPPFSTYMNTHRFEGWLAGAGLSYGYRWNFSHRWAMEATLGVGYAYLSYDKYPCYTCGKKIGSETKNYFGPTKAGISLIFNIGGKKKTKPAPAVTPVVIPVSEPKPQPKVIYQPQFAVSYIVPEAEPVKRRCDMGKAYLDFPLGKSVIMPGFKNNPEELGKIDKLIGCIKRDTNITITGITVIGYASPDGTYQSNLLLSEKRATALKEYVTSKYGISGKLLTVKGEGEDWKTLDSLVSVSGMAGKNEILSIIRNTDIFDGREKKLMNLSGGVSYREMLAAMFPQLRRVDYELHYTVQPFTVEKGKEVIRTRPSSLSLNELFLIANTYEPGSEAFNEVFETAVRIFPGSDTANLNAAASALNRKDVVSAEQYLLKVTTQDAAYWNNLGVLYGLKKEYGKAAEYFGKAETLGNIQAASNIKEVRKTEGQQNQ